MIPNRSFLTMLFDHVEPAIRRKEGQVSVLSEESEKQISTILNSGWIQTSKYQLSSGAGVDVGVPYTIAVMLRIEHRLDDPEYRGFVRKKVTNATYYHFKLKPEEAFETYRRLLVGYLLGNSLPGTMWTCPGNPGVVFDLDGQQHIQLEGELLRHASRRQGKPVEEIILGQSTIDDYCVRHGIEKIAPEFARKLGILYFSESHS